jgi:hypothetical protein
MSQQQKRRHLIVRQNRAQVLATPNPRQFLNRKL